MRRRNNDFQLAGTKRQCGNLKQFFRCQEPPQPEGSHTSRRVPTPPPKYSIFSGEQAPQTPRQKRSLRSRMDPPLRKSWIRP